MYYIGTKQDCIYYNHIVSVAEGYQDSTIQWAEIISHPNGKEFAITKHENYTSNLTLVEVLSSDWFNNDI